MTRTGFGAGGAATREGATLLSTAMLLLAVVLVALPFRRLPSWTFGATPEESIGLFDGLLLALTCVCVPLLARLHRARPGGRRSSAAIVAAVVVGLYGLSLLAHPSWTGLVTVGRVGATAVVVLTLRAVEPTRVARVLLRALLAGAAVQAVIVVGQLLAGGPLGLSVLGEDQSPFYPVGTALAPRGTFQHPYPLTGFAVLATVVALTLGSHLRCRRALAWALGVAAVPIGVTYSRSAVLAMALVGGSVVLARRDRARGLATGLATGLAAVAAGALVAALVWPAGWQARMSFTSHAVTTGDADTLAHNRLSLARWSLRTIGSSPVVGVGPGRFSPGAVVAGGQTTGGDIVHNLPLFVATEAGVPAGVMVAAVLLAVGVRAIRADARARTLYLAFLPFLLLDRFPYDGAQGLVLTAVWLGAVEVLVGLAGRQPRSETDEAGVTVVEPGHGSQAPSGIVTA